MLDYFAIFTKGGALLWTLQFTAALKHNPVDALNALIRTCLLEERSADSTFYFTPKAGAAQALKWTFHNGLGLVFVAVYQKTLSLLYVDELLQRVRDAFVLEYKPSQYGYDSFTSSFQAILHDCEAKADAARRPQQIQQQRGSSAGGAAARGSKGGQQPGKQGSSAAKGKQSSDEEDEADAGGKTGSSEESSAANSEEEEPAGKAAGANAFDTSKLGKLGGRRTGPGPRKGPRRTKEEEEKPKSQGTPEKPKGKSARNWNQTGKADEDLKELDFSSNKNAANGTVKMEKAVVGPSMMDEEEIYDSDDEEELGPQANGKMAANGTAAAKSGVLGSFVNRLSMRVVGKESLSSEDLAPALEDMKRRLMERNVAEEIAVQVCNSVAQSLEGKKLSSFTGVSRFVKDAFEDSLSRILNKRQVDVLADIERAKAKGKPYVIVFCGVNGVGKSTNLAKICYWLGEHGFQVQLAACDTFRAGAVEQLRTHAVRLGVDLYERGYEKDPAKVAAEAIKVAERNKKDVVLVDTAGRMQDNEPLMRALSNLIHVNQPQLVLFVGEALVGNDAVDQLTKFARALYDMAPAGTTRRHMIDGIVLTKFDTIDDKVGAALSMVYTSGAPVMFVGCGQTYVDLKKLPVKSVVKSLLN